MVSRLRNANERRRREDREADLRTPAATRNLMKACPRCRKVKPASSFTKSRRAKDGLAGWCRDCINGRVRDWHRDNPEFVPPNSHAALLQSDPIEYTKRHCAHVARYVARAIGRLEQAGLEPPPQLTAI